MTTNLPSFPAQGGHIEMPERVISVVAGLGLAASAAKPRPNYLLSITALAIGVFLTYRGVTGYCPARAALDA